MTGYRISPEKELHHDYEQKTTGSIASSCNFIFPTNASPRDKQMHFRYDKAYSIGQRRPSEVPLIREVSVMGAFFRIQGDAL